MKKILFLIALCFNSLLCVSQEKTLQEHKDGTKWYLLKDDKTYGALDQDGNVLIPLSKGFNYVSYYHADNTDRGFFDVQKGDFHGIYDKSGNEIISTERGYSMIVYQVTLDGYKYFGVTKNDKDGACDLKGKEIVPPKYYAVTYYGDCFGAYLDENLKEWIDLGIKLEKKDILSDDNFFKRKMQEDDGFEWYIVYKGDLCGAENKEEKFIIPIKYDGISYESKNSGNPYFKVKKNGKYGAYDISGKEAIPALYHYVTYFNSGFATQLKEGDSFVYTDIKLDTNGMLISKSDNNSKNVSTSSYSKTNLKEVFQQAYDLPDSELDRKVELYVKILREDPYNYEGLNSRVYNNIGVMFETIDGNFTKAKEFFEKALEIDPSNSTAAENLKSIKKQRRAERWNKIGNALGTIGSALGSMNGGQTNYNGDTYQNSGSFNSSTPSGTSSGDRLCPSCQGSGKCSTQGVYDKYRCHGSGRCQHCNGSGTQRDYGNTRVCSTCNGTRKCHYCGGSGNCSTCGGSGRR